MGAVSRRSVVPVSRLGGLKMDALFSEIPAICQAARTVMCHRFRWQIPHLSLDPGMQAPDWFGNDPEDLSIRPPPDLERNRQVAIFLSVGDIAATCTSHGNWEGKIWRAARPWIKQFACLSPRSRPTASAWNGSLTDSWKIRGRN